MLRSSSRTWRARTGAATSRARCSRGSTGPRGRRRKTSTPTCTGWRKPSGATTGGSGAELDLFSFPDEIGSGLAVFHPKGGLIRTHHGGLLSRADTRRRGTTSSISPHITKSELFETSGHLDWYADGMFPPMELDGGTDYYLKPMNCPFHVLIYRSRTRSYRELPLRLFEFGTVYRYEKSGVVHGLTRVRGMTQDDAHIFCTQEQMGEELRSLLTFVLDLLRDYGLDDFYLELSTKPDVKSVGLRRGLGRRPPRHCGRRRSRWIWSWSWTRAAARSTGRRSPCRRAMRSAARGRCPRSSWTSRSRSASTCTTPATTARAIGPS